jgi:hypothetical protein
VQRWVQNVMPLLGAALLAALAVSVALYWRRARAERGRRPGASRWQRRRANGEPVREPCTSALTVEFYRRLEAALTQLGLSRGVGQTPRELACQAEERLAALSPRAAVAELPPRIVEILSAVPTLPRTTALCSIIC